MINLIILLGIQIVNYYIFENLNNKGILDSRINATSQSGLLSSNQKKEKPL
jgi:hypothetical protein